MRWKKSADLLSRRNFICAGSSAATGLILPERLNLFDTASVALPASTYRNPVIAGDHPDAGAIRVGKDYYLTHTTNSYTPGLLLWHSRDLVHWKVAGAALDQYYGDVWAPYLCEYNGRFYIYFPCDGKLQVLHAASPLGPWSKPVPLGLNGIDPAHIATPDGRRYLYIAGGYCTQLSSDGLSVQGKPKKVIDLWPIPENWRVECACMEAPKLFYRDGYYYLTVAQGGTSGPPTSHMVLSARSRDVEGPWEWSPFNPIVHTYSAKEKWWSKGHGRLVESSDGSWWMTLHAYKNGLRTLGRQILLLPVEWTRDDWYRVPAGTSAADPIHKSLLPPATSPEQEREAFAGPGLDPQWQFWKGYDPARVYLAHGALTLAAHGASIATTSALTRVATDRVYTVEVDVEIESGCEAGLLLFYDSTHVCGLRLNAMPHAPAQPRTTLIHATRATLRIVNDDQEVDFFYRTENSSGTNIWTRLRESFDVTCFNHNAFGGFLDLRPALYACGSGSATFRNWRYVPQAIEMA